MSKLFWYELCPNLGISVYPSMESTPHTSFNNITKYVYPQKVSYYYNSNCNRSSSL